MRSATAALILALDLLFFVAALCATEEVRSATAALNYVLDLLFFVADLDAIEEVRICTCVAAAVLNSTLALLFFLRSASAALAFGSALDFSLLPCTQQKFFVALPQP